jgi:hypothetical protein
MSPVCICGENTVREMKTKETGVIVVDHYGGGNYTVRNADLFECPLCGRQEISGFGVQHMMDKSSLDSMIKWGTVTVVSLIEWGYGKVIRKKG